jgi:F-type H+-transporting ATPase subunit alpha
MGIASRVLLAAFIAVFALPATAEQLVRIGAAHFPPYTIRPETGADTGLLPQLVEALNKVQSDYQFVLVPKDFDKPLATREDAVDGKVFGGPISKHDAQLAHKAMPAPDNYKVVKLAGSGGSLTALPIIETLLGDVSAYVPTNVISITDGQIYLENDLFNAGIRPAINVGISVSRVGGDAQTKAIRQVAGRLRLDMASYRSLAAFAQFGSGLDKVTLNQLNRGQHLQEILKQPQYEPVSLESQVITLYAGTNGFSDQIAIEKMRAWEQGLVRFMETSYPEIGRAIVQDKRITDETETRLKDALTAYNAGWTS